jgi:hypothetical protein
MGVVYMSFTVMKGRKVHGLFSHFDSMNAATNVSYHHLGVHLSLV